MERKPSMQVLKVFHAEIDFLVSPAVTHFPPWRFGSVATAGGALAGGGGGAKTTWKMLQ